MQENIVLPAWQIASTTTQLKKFNFFPSLFATTYLAGIVCYQVAWSWVYLFDTKDEFFRMALNFVHASYFGESLALGIFVMFAYMVLNPIAEGGLIALVSKADEGTIEDRPYSFAFSRGMRAFLPIFEAHNLLALFKLISIITSYLFLLRIFGKSYAFPITVGMTIYLLFSFFVNILTAYTRFFIVFEDKKAFEAMSLSVGMAIDNIATTFRLYFTLLLVYVRTLLTVIAFIVFPFVVSAILTYLTIGWIQTIFIILSFVGIIGFLLFVSHLNSVLEIFVEALWYHAYKENKVNGQKLAIDSVSDKEE